MRAEHFQKFLAEMQGKSLTEDEVEQIMITYLKENGSVIEKLARPKFSLDHFFGYLFSEHFNSPINPSVHHDMTAPMSHYFIYTGHNSYLTGNQLTSACDDKPLIEALRRGVRVIELDLWPNASKDKIEVKHGRTLTTPVDFEKCISAIKENAFVKSEYPVVITLEDHLPAHLQAQVAEIVHRVIGSTLFIPDSEEGLMIFPSPEVLKNRILISTKPPKEYPTGHKNDKGPEEMEDGPSENGIVVEEKPWGEELPDVTTAPDKESSPEQVLEKEISDEESKPSEKQQETNVAPEYKRIITIRTRKFISNSMSDSLAMKDQYVKRVSLSEPQLSKAVKAHSNEVLSFTQSNLLRIYPYGLRFDSSNYNPLQAWTHGAQMVALNMQGYGRPLWLVHGLFRANGGCGYVKKPPCLIAKSTDADSHEHIVFDPLNPGPVKKTLKVKVYMGYGWSEKFSKTHFDTFSPPDFYTRVGIAGVKADTVMKKTEIIPDNWAPHWNEEFEFTLRVPELALLRIEVHEYDLSDKDDFGGQTCLPVSELRPGIWTVPLYDQKGKELDPVRLLVRFRF